MKKTGQCPKCGSQQLMNVAHALNSKDRIHTHVAGLWGRRVAGTVLGLPPLALQLVYCQQCGKAELYVNDPGSIPVDGQAVRPLGS
jgi:predicted nucleic-acid-binding Zn-ribbon protein